MIPAISVSNVAPATTGNPPQQDITQLLTRWKGGQSDALNSLIDQAYDQLCTVAHRLLGRERRLHTLQTAGLVHEAYLRLQELKGIHWRDRGHFFAVWTGIMRRVLIDRARSAFADKRGGHALRVTLTDGVASDSAIDVLELEDALLKLAAADRTLATVVELRYFAGLTVEETAQALEISPATVKRKWSLAQAWLFRELNDVQGCTNVAKPKEGRERQAKERAHGARYVAKLKSRGESDGSPC